ncbi:MAG: PQQ-dependent sugar dehydrogenase [bacterium]|nr:PQQ-dependent sugar dehydrogenase [bacterium]
MRLPAQILTLCACALSLAPTTRAQGVRATQVDSIPQRPTAMASAPGDPTRLWFPNKLGRIYIIKNGTRLSTPYMDMSSIVDDPGESGLLGMAMHPDYVNNGLFYVAYTSGPNADTVISQFERDASNPDLADITTEQIIFGPYPHTSPDHKAGGLTFGPDGYLYYGHGDGLSGGLGVGERAQDPMDLRGKILRFDPDIPFPHIPADNPFVGNSAVADEIYALGLRNPFAIGVDSLTGDLYIGDVGQSTAEEINFVPAGGGGLNFGWKCKEGTACFGSPPPSCVCSNPAFVDPLHTYGTGQDGCAVIGGVVYRGSAIPSLYGWYLFSDFCTARVWALQHDGTTVTDFQDLTDQMFPSGGFGSPVAFGEDANGELYLVEHFSGRVWRVRPHCEISDYCSANPNSTGNPAEISVTGIPSVTAANLTLNGDGLPPNQFGYFLMAQTQDFLALFGGSQGNLCLGMPIVRFAGDILNTGAGGSVSFPPDFGNLPNGATFEVGDTWNFQLWYRDQNPTTTSNTTAGVSVQFCP